MLLLPDMLNRCRLVPRVLMRSPLVPSISIRSRLVPTIASRVVTTATGVGAAPEFASA
jgi:hypothetical protein